MNKRRGVSLVILVITVVVALILLSIGIVTIDKNLDNAVISGLMNDLKDIEDSASAYLIDNGSLDFEVKTYDEILLLLDDVAKDSFKEELNLNSDSDEKEFYVVNLPKIGVLKSTRGNKTSGENDIYVITKDTFHAYYLKGVLVNNIYYFSISSKINEL